MSELSEKEIENYRHFKIKTKDNIELDLIETKYYKNLLDLYQKEKELSLKRFKNLVKIQEEKDKNYNKGYFQGRRDERNETDNKIKETIEDYTEKSKHPLVNAQSRREYTFGIRALQELLEERS